MEMKRFSIVLLVFVSSCLPALTLSGQVSLDIKLTKPGSLKTHDFYPNIPNSVKNLTLSGKIDASDIRFMRDEMDSLEVLDLSDVNIVYYSGEEGTRFGIYDIYLDHSIPISSFENKESLTSIILPKTAISVELFAFAGCKNLKEAILSKSTLESIGDSAFAGCISLGDSLAFPSVITSIGTAAFAGCKNLSILYFPPSLTLIRQRAFESCTGLQKIVNMRSYPILMDESVFGGVNQAACSLVVLPTSVCRYHNFPVWKEFSFDRNCYSVRVINNYPTSGYIIGEGYHSADSIVTLLAIPYSDCEFLRWSITKQNDTAQWEEVVSTDSSFSFTITQDTSFIVHFCRDGTNTKALYSEKDFVNIYPNPTNSQLHIETQFALEEIIIYDISGKMIQQWKNTNSPIDISNFPSGIYFLRLSADKNNVIRKVVKY